MRALSRRAVCAVLAAGLMASSPASAAPPPVSDPEAVAHFQAAGTAYESEDYAKAAEHIKAAYAIEQAPELLWSWATIERRAKNYKVAAGLYEAFIEAAPDHPSAGKARTLLVEMRALAGEPVPPPELPDASDEPAEDVEPTPVEDDTEPAPPKASLRDEKLAPALLGVGGAIAIVGGVLMGLGSARVSDSPSAATEDAYFAEIDVGRNTYYGGAAMLGAGGLIMIGGAIRYAIVAKRGKTPKSNATAVVTPHAVGLGWSGRF